MSELLLITFLLKAKSNPPITYKCKYCKVQICGAQTSKSNLYCHCDGSKQKECSQVGCGKRHLAIEQGAKLPPTVQELRAGGEESNSTKITEFFAPTNKFDNDLFNQMVIMWLIRHALPWSHVEDPELRAIFD